MVDSDESGMENGENDDYYSGTASTFDESTTNETVRQDSDSDETGYHSSDVDVESGPADADNEDEVALNI